MIFFSPTPHRQGDVQLLPREQDLSMCMKTNSIISNAFPSSFFPWDFFFCQTQCYTVQKIPEASLSQSFQLCPFQLLVYPQPTCCWGSVRNTDFDSAKTFVYVISTVSATKEKKVMILVKLSLKYFYRVRFLPTQIEF